MKCLSLHQPWATLVVTGHKKIETRGWHTSHRGPLLIHASKLWNPGLAEMCTREHYRQALESAGVEFLADMDAVKRGWNLPFGAIIGRVNVTACYETTPFLRDYIITDQEEAFGDFGEGRFAWILKEPLWFPVPIPFKGRQQLFNVPDGLEGVKAA